jgi:type IV pilus assembly protein PilC
MNYQYVAYTEDRRLVKGKVSSTSEEAAANLLSYSGYQIVSLKETASFFDSGKLAAYFSRLKTSEIIMFSRQLALLLESGTDIVTALELLQNQVNNRTLKRILGEIVSDIRGGSPLSSAMSKHPQAFPDIYYRTIAVGEQSGNLEAVLRQMADYHEKRQVTEKKIKNALTYPFVVAVVAVVVIGIMIAFVLPTFVTLYEAFGADLPLPTKLLIGASNWLLKYGVFLVFGIIISAVVGILYTRTPAGKYQQDKLMLNLPVIGRIVLLNELSRCAQTMSVLLKVGLPLPEIMTMAIRGTGNRTVSEALTEVQQGLIRGEGLAKPMRAQRCFLPMMVQMVGVGEETGSLDNTLATVAQVFGNEADERTSTAAALLQPAITIAIAVVIGFIALALVSAMYSIYGQTSF